MAQTQDIMERLFLWKTEVTYRGTTFHQRIVSDATIEDARQHALVASRKLRRDLRNKESDSYLIYLDPINDLNDEDLRNAIVYGESRDVMSDFIRSTPRRVVDKPGDGATLEDQELYQEELEKRDTEYGEELKRHIDLWEVDYRRNMEKWDRERLTYQYTQLQTDSVCNAKFTEVFEQFVLAASVYLDGKFKQRAFTNEEFASLPESVRQMFRDSYNNINIGADDIKN